MRARHVLPAVTVLALLAAGCSTGGGTGTTVPRLVKAPPQTAALDWSEPYPAVRPALVFDVASFTVTRDGWRADISVENRSDVGWEVGDVRYASNLAFGVMLFPNDDTGELERRNRSGTLPAIRPAMTFRPALPDVLRPGAVWRGTMSAPGALAGGLWVRISFGPFVALGDAPKGTSSQVVWFTDHAHQLVQQVSASPA
jgi:hypothetical protein